MPDPLIVVDTSKVNEGKLEEVRAGVAELVDFVEANEPEPLAYNIYFDEEGTTMTVVQAHPSSESFERHMEVAGPVFRRFTDLVTLWRVLLRQAERSGAGANAAKGEAAGERDRRRERPPGGLHPARRRLDRGYALFPAVALLGRLDLAVPRRR
jgi:quinol monooxygenase YgiN